jgi:hypothetical protein
MKPQAFKTKWRLSPDDLMGAADGLARFVP